MSRTKSGAKYIGEEFESRRPGNRHGGLTGAWAKKRTHKVERLRGKASLNQED